jgi:hypothetical protein
MGIILCSTERKKKKGANITEAVFVTRHTAQILILYSFISPSNIVYSDPMLIL